jgi:competence protein ComEA
MPTFALSRRHALVAVTVAVAVVLLASRLVGPHEQPTSTASPPLLPARAAVEPGRTVVDVAGAVRRPGVYRLKRGARVADAIARAGGPTRRADVAFVNLAAPVADGQQIVVPRRTPGAPGVGLGSGSPAAPAGPVSLSSATVEQLDALPGIGPVTAQKIVAYRAEHGAFRSVDELDAIPGIGPARLETLRGLVVP